jgi:hypothetical protein
VSGATQDPTRARPVLSYGAITLSRSLFQVILLTFRVPHRGPTTPKRQVASVWAGPLSLATTQGIASLSFPPLTEMFHFSGFASHTLCIQVWITLSGWVFPFGDLRIIGRVRLPEAFRSLPRPSSPGVAKASVNCF